MFYVWYVCLCLSAILFDEVRYVQSDADLQALERTARGKTDIVLGYIQMLGTPGTQGQGSDGRSGEGES